MRKAIGNKTTNGKPKECTVRLCVCVCACVCVRPHNHISLSLARTHLSPLFDLLLRLFGFCVAERLLWQLLAARARQRKLVALLRANT